jgi:hypothetical protein
MIQRKLGLPALFLAGAILGSALTGTALAYQPNMRAALTALNTAQSDLKAALPDKAGHRVNAMKLVGQAITEVQAGIAACTGRC